LTVKPCDLDADLSDVQPSPASRASDVPAKSPTSGRRRAAIALSLLLIAVRVGLFVSGHGGGVAQRLPDQSCASSGIEPPDAREGICARYQGGGIVVYNVVNRAGVLHMPEYDARLLDERLTNTRVSNWRKNPDLYPGRHGTLLSFEVAITNPGTAPLQIGPLVERSATPSYRAAAPAEALLPRSPGSPQVIGYPALYSGRGAPYPSLFGQPPILPRTSLVGWITTVTPFNASTLMTQPRANLDFAPVDGNPDYVGQIRLWK
jgi:hypothetical protein